VTSTALSGRVALVTGAGGAIGQAVLRRLREQGALAVGADLKGRPLLETERPWEAEPVALDVRSRPQLLAFVDSLRQRLGPVDTLVNVAGVVSFGSAQDLAEAEWDRVIDINLKGSFLAAQAVIPGMRELGFGRIVNLGSVVGKNSGNARPWISPDEQNRASNVAYGVSKAGIHSMTGFLARELACHGITVNAVAPGPIATEMTTDFPAALRALIPRGRMGTPEDVVRAVSFLIQRESDFITGEVLDVNGGMWSD
jgi:3-oxoacyl-[acyl-carrier protein] reductase